MRGFRDRDFLQTEEGLFFCVVGSSHPPKRVISYIKYAPSESGVWGNGKKKFSRIFQKYTIPNLLETFKYIEKNHPNYQFYSPADNITITAVPHESIKKHFKPEQKLAQLSQSKNLDILQDKLVRFAKFLENISGISFQSFGVTGSLLLDIHKPEFSDIDIIVYGVKESWKLKNILNESRSSEISMKRLEGKALKDWCIKKAKQYPLTAKEALRIYERKWNLGFFEDKWVSVHPVKIENEITKKYGAQIYIPCGQVTIKADVSDNKNSLFLPATYNIDNVKFLDGKHLGDITEVVSYEGLYCSIAENGETIQARGKLEKVEEKGKGSQHYRVLVGSAMGNGKDFMKLLE
jgi:predicted nucleotidyltransferase